ncbi:fused (3R)-hydroxyacyl-ACP dehydratase subunits HadA/HadB [Nocardia sp. CNY236]|uniref:fused (3R)-hydroxyacyl-ACP dehydratase subunits HadA/HadB n=1 Tax=Nocardia sp. CNY236 TaxID=1169152 RepID=UPI00042566DA|nr:fused (3R)-hydroxyacyl-ACP dehydratase subunits HadA/HadB [Nocardia sp. CNY236]
MNSITHTASDQARSLVGRQFRLTDHYEVGREKIREFARALQDDHPAHRNESAAAEFGFDGLIAPLTFSSIVLMVVQRAMFESVLTGYDLGQVLQTEQSIQVHRPIVAGDHVQCDSYFESFRQFGDKDFLVIKTVLTNQHKDVLQTAHSTAVAQTESDLATELRAIAGGVIMTGQSAADRSDAAAVRGADVDTGLVECFDEPAQPCPGDAPRTPRTVPAFDELFVGMELAPRTALLSRGDLVNYAGVSGDSNPIHFSDAVARSAGLPDVVSHGLLTMGLGARYLTAWSGDPVAVAKYAVRFAGLAPIPATKASTIEFRGRVKDMDPDRRAATVALSATCAGRKLFGRATAELLLR